MFIPLVILLSLLSIIILVAVPDKYLKFVKQITLFISGVICVLSANVYSSFNSELYSYNDTFLYRLDLNILNLPLSFGLDSISIVFFFFTAILIFLCLIYIWEETRYRDYALALVTLSLILLMTFSVTNLFFFYVCFEATLIPMFLIIGIWGSRERKIRAVYLFFLLHIMRIFINVNWYFIHLF